MRSLLLIPLLLLLAPLAGCQNGAPCTWLITNETGETWIELVTSRPSGQWGEDILADEPLPYNDQVAIDIEAGRPHSILAVGFSGDRYLIVRAVDCEDGEQLFTSIGISDREL